MKEFFKNEYVTVFNGDCSEILKELPDCSVQCCVTSPPYMGLRDYGTAVWIGGSSDCSHIVDESKTKVFGNPEFNKNRPCRKETKLPGFSFDKVCSKCGAVKTDKQIGMEKSPELYVEKLVSVFREVRRVLKDDGTVWLNIGDSYANSGTGGNGLTGGKR